MGSPKPQMPGTPTSYAPPAPATAANAAAVQASADARQKAGEKKGISSTLLQQDPLSDENTAPVIGGKNTLLGGG